MSSASKPAGDLEFLAENATDVLSRHAPDGTFLYVSGSSRRVFGYDPEELVGNSVYDYFHPDDVPMNEQVHGRILEQGDAVDTRYRFRCHDGTYLEVESNARRIVNEAGEIVEFHAVTRDMRGRIEGEELRRQWEACFKSTSRGITITDLADGAMKSVNPALATMHGGAMKDFVEKPISALMTPESAERLPAFEMEAEERGYVSYEAEHVRLDGSTFPVSTEVITVRREDGSPLYRVIWFEDLTERRLSDRRREEVRRDFESAFEAAPIGVALVDLNGRFARANRRLCSLLSYSEEELQALTFQEVTHPEDLEGDLELLEDLLGGKIPGYELEKRYFTREGHQVWVHLSVTLVRDDDGAPLHFISHVQDISSRKRMEGVLRDLSEKDPLTGLMNRRCFEEDLGRQAARCSRYGEQVALIVLALDGLSEVNEAHGHRAGDQVIRAVGRGLLDRVRGSDRIARIAGDEFAVLLINVSDSEAVVVAEQMRERIQRDSAQRGDAVTASVGVVHFPGEPVNADSMLSASEMAMHEAKRAGRNRVVAPQRAH